MVYICNNASHGPGLHYCVDLWIQTYTEPVPLKCEKLATKYQWIYGYFYSAERRGGQVFSSWQEATSRMRTKSDFCDCQLLFLSCLLRLNSLLNLTVVYRKGDFIAGDAAH